MCDDDASEMKLYRLNDRIRVDGVPCGWCTVEMVAVKQLLLAPPVSSGGLAFLISTLKQWFSGSSRLTSNRTVRDSVSLNAGQARFFLDE